MMKRGHFECGVFEDIEAARRYDRETRAWMRYVARGFISIAQKWGVTSGRVLDVGTGTGMLAIELAKRIHGVEVVGLDLSDVVLELARDNARKTEVAPRVSFEHGDAEDMPFEDDTFALVISSNTLHLVKNPIRMFDEIHRVLKPEGRFLISDFRRSWLGAVTQHIRASYSPNEVEDLLRQSKLRKWQVQDRFFWLNIVSKS